MPRRLRSRRLAHADETRTREMKKIRKSLIVAFLLLTASVVSACCNPCCEDWKRWWEPCGGDCGPCGDPCDPCDTR